VGLGLFRLVLSLWVIDHHYTLSERLVGPFVINAFGERNLGLLKIGHIAVISFFVLSGYVITWVLKSKYPQNKAGINTFFIGRAIRIYPLYWAIFVTYVAVLFWVPGVVSEDELISFSSLGRLVGDFLLFPYGIAGFFLTNNHYAYGMINLPAWTLPYDLVFYLVAPWMVMKKRILLAIIVLELLYLLFLSQLAPVPQFKSWHSLYLTTGHAQLLAFSMGSMAWYFRGIRIPAWLLGGAMAFMLYLVFVPYKLTDLYLNHLLVIVLTVIVVIGLKKRNRLDNFLGELTYSTYLLHMPLLMILTSTGLVHPSIVALGVTYLISPLVVKFFEAPLEKRRKAITVNRLKTAKNDPLTSRSSGRYIVAIIFIYIAVSAGYNLYWVSVNGVI
jgi:peptidoglycan/LPS O-acetylase OafA/YrhL